MVMEKERKAIRLCFAIFVYWILGLALLTFFFFLGDWMSEQKRSGV